MSDPRFVSYRQHYGRRQYVVPRWLIWAVILGGAALAWFGCQQPFGFAPGQKTLCPAGTHVVYIKDGYRCVQDSTSTSP